MEAVGEPLSLSLSLSLSHAGEKEKRSRGEAFVVRASEALRCLVSGVIPAAF
jgi:azurin